VRWLTDDEYPTIVAKADSEEAKRAVNMTVSQADGVKAKAAPLAIPGKAPAPVAQADEEEDETPAPAPAKKAAKPKAEPVEAAEDDGGEPEVRKAAPKAAAVPEKKSKLSAIVSDWDDE
jgi:hypothetical protein